MYRSKIGKLPFGYLGCKLKSLTAIMPVLPYRIKYVEPFGGTGAVLLNRSPSIVEVYNDRYSGLTDFYLCVQDDKLFAQLKEKIYETIHSREFFQFCRDTWKEQDSHVDRAFRWYYMTRYSFAQLGRNFGRSTGILNGDSGKLIRSVPMMNEVNLRLRKVLIENQDAMVLMKDFDDKETVFYLDPPYLNCSKPTGEYVHNIDEDYHKKLLDLVFSLKGFVALSGYPNDLYDQYPWDKVYKWPVRLMVKPMSFTDGNHKIRDENSDKRGKVMEYLWVKY